MALPTTDRIVSFNVARIARRDLHFQMLQDRSSRINCLGIYVIIDERIVVQADGASDIAGMSDHSLKLPFGKRNPASASGRLSP
jgi:hypothetical protein